MKESPMLMQVSTIAQLTILAPIGNGAGDDSPICLVNTHLFFHPRANFIRTLHTAAIMEEASKLIQAVARGSPAELGNRTPAVIFCGDLNSGHNKGISGEDPLIAFARHQIPAASCMDI